MLATFQPLMLAYIGPGTGLTGIVLLLAVVAAAVVVVIGFLWYPLKALRRRARRVPHSVDTIDELFEE
jgi:hypothetical protein